MIPRIVHYCWFGKGQKPQLVEQCIASWHRCMPDWAYMEWSEDNFAIASAPLYVRQAYEARKYAFVSDYVRLWALEQYGGVYLDTDVEIIRNFEPLLQDTAFIGFEESLAHMPGTCVMGCEPHCQWVKDMMASYDNVRFVNEDGTYDLTTNVQRLGEIMVAGGMVPNGKKQYIDKWGLRIYDHHHFSPITSTRVMRKNKDTYSIHHFAGSWTGKGDGHWYDHPICREVINVMIQVKRKILGQK